MKNAELPERILSISANSRLEANAEGFYLQRESGSAIALELEGGFVFLTRREEGGWFVLPHLKGPGAWQGDSLAWVLPREANASLPSWQIQGPDGCLLQVQVGQSARIEVQAEWVEVKRYESRPRADIFGKRYAFDFQNGALLEQACAAFYWDTLLPCVVERTRAAGFPTPDGFVLSTLAPNSYGGTYPDVDHEFQVKGRLAAGSALDEDVVRRMLELQLRMMREDPEGLWRNPCAVQSDGQREYHVRRSSQDGSQNAVMFLLTGNVEILE